MLIGIEEHWTSAQLREAQRAVPVDRRDDSLALDEMGDHLERLTDLADGRIAAMDEQGVDIQVLSLSPPATGPLAGPDAVALSRELNDRAAAAVAEHPSRLRFLATVPLADPGVAAGELERAVGLGAVGLMVYGRTGDTPLDDPAYDDVLATAAALRKPVFIHPQIAPAAVREASYAGFDELTSLALSTFAWGWHLEAAIAALRLMARGTLDRHPDLQLVLGHWGELMAFWTSRTDSLGRVAHLDRRPSQYLRENVHLTCSGMLEPALLRHTLEVTTPDRLLFSTDYPFQHPSRDDIAAFLTEFARNTGGDADREAFSSGNARQLFGIEA